MRRAIGTSATCALAMVAVLAFPHHALAVGELTPAGCIDDNDSGADVCAQSVNGLQNASSVAVSPDGRSVYVASADDNAVVAFNRSASGALTPAGCIDDNDVGEDVCARSVNGLDAVFSVAVSPDGRSLYAVALSDSALVRFNRSVSGALTPAGCIDDNDTGADSCAQSVNGMTTANSVAVSPDGRSVYVASLSDDAVVRFNRSETGALTPAGCVDDNDTGLDSCGQSINGLGSASDVAVSPDGSSVYVSSIGDDTLVRFNRSPSGALTPGGCIADEDTGTDTCAQLSMGLNGPGAIAVSPDGSSVYVASAVDDAVSVFGRSPSGALTPAGCVDDNDDVNDECARSVNGLDAPVGLVVSPDGESLYVASLDDALVRFNRSASGVLAPAGCIDDNDTGPDVCAQSVNGLDGAKSVAVSPGNDSVYVAAGGDNAIVSFNRKV